MSASEVFEAIAQEDDRIMEELGKLRQRVKDLEEYTNLQAHEITRLRAQLDEARKQLNAG